MSYPGKNLLTSLFFMLLLALPMVLQAQDNDEISDTDTTSVAQEERAERTNAAPSIRDRIFFGGNFALSFGNVNTFVNISPRVGYRVTDRFSAGVGITYMYWRFNNRFAFNNVSTSVYGGNIFTRYAITNQIFAHAEGELLSAEDFTTQDEGDRTLVPGLFIGGGYAVRLGNRSFLNIMVLYNLLYDNNVSSPYTSPIDVRIGVQL